MQKFDKSAAWDDVKRLLGAHQSLVWTIAGVFIFLPQLVAGLLMPTTMGTPDPALSPEAQLELMSAELWRLLPLAIVAGILAYIGYAAILRLWLSRTEISVGDAIRTALGLVLTIFAIQIVTGFAAALGAFLLIIPGIYIWVRWSVASAYAVDMNERNPIDALTASWRLTKGNVFSIFTFWFLLIVAAFVVIIVVSMLSSLFAVIPAVGLFLVQAVNALLVTAVNILFMAVAAATYRQLVVMNSAAMGQGE